jgi:hypothetical protein
MRKSCETVAGFCLGNIVATSLRSPSGINKIAITCGCVGFALGVIGATIRMPRRINNAAYDAALKRVFKKHRWLRLLALICLAAGITLLIADVWAADGRPPR